MIAGGLTAATSEAARSAGATLYAQLFMEFEDAYHRQVCHPPLLIIPLVYDHTNRPVWKVHHPGRICLMLNSMVPAPASQDLGVFLQEALRCLHTHLGSRVKTQTSTALHCLLQLSSTHVSALLGYAAFLTSIIEYLEDYENDQLHQVSKYSCMNVAAYRISSPLRLTPCMERGGPFSLLQRLFCLLYGLLYSQVL